MMDKQHIANTIIVVVLLAFAFSYRFEGAFTLSNWLATFFVTFVLVAFSVSMHNFAQGKIANHYLADIHTQVFAAGSLTTLITMFLSSGTIIYASPWTLKLKSLFSTTLGKRLAPGPSEFAKIALAGTLTSLFIAVGAQLLTPFLGQIAEILVKINVAIAISSLIPFLTLFPHTIPYASALASKPKADEAPHTIGDHLFFGSRPLWAFSIAFVSAAGVGLLLYDSLYVLLGALFAGLLVWLAWLYHVEGFKPKP